ncbi:uncharacterized protein PGTG_13194 [Puccinia graminis f. sp. tritici CRL 75-36-700-3]|uniref:Dolichol-phosphate mannosyltransferase subunit 3 n=1 Tax=Puccinia graminis f. sp. tritici (strain CRL 75-36-700-3 / race SCCL) TaxID=418459 RepID=E3KR87_PUCGT|nr:uncharacterized protein PGTG_13194 [Puccinia graminis f. sp. tritici CRL 75-36-700-3]EFP86812.1 hypothetical protein PGTG_13194 [Puccinia graminis f. sp. tritici CRL 75-36-700-3]
MYNLTITTSTPSLRPQNNEKKTTHKRTKDGTGDSRETWLRRLHLTLDQPTKPGPETDRIFARLLGPSITPPSSSSSLTTTIPPKEIELQLSNVPIGLSVVVFGAVCLTKILLDISISNHPKIHEEAYQELLSDIRMAKEDLRSKGISVD